MEACDLNFTHSLKKLNKNVCVKTEGNEVVEENTEIEKKEKVRTVQKNPGRGVQWDFEERGFLSQLKFVKEETCTNCSERLTCGHCRSKGEVLQGNTNRELT